MSDWTEEVQAFEERNLEDLVDDFIAKNNEAWNDFVWARWSKQK